jgi:lipoic acid synthetase
MNLKHAVITSVNRDDRIDGGAPLFAMVIAAQIAAACVPSALILTSRGHRGTEDRNGRAQRS